ncbi:MAG: cation:proton antiporter [Alphaproteobacteria bacterium]|nr:cation:proton antiporter [Alphaproteobacteria bacterium]
MHQDPFLTEILSLIAVAVVAATVFGRLGFGAILGFLVGGMLIGPWGLGLVTDAAGIAHLGEFGVIFLLFLIGIELKPARLWVMRRQVFGLGTAQLLVCGAALAGLTSLFLDLDAGQLTLIGLGLGLSSTAFGIQLLASRRQLASQWGRAGFSILLLQDLAVVPLLALVPILGKGEVTLGASFGLAILETVAILTGVILIGRLAINPLFRLVAATKMPEVFTGLALLLVLGFGWFMDHIGLSMAMGAFIAGLLMAESEFRHQVEVDILPFRGLLLGLFFVSVGMGINFGTLAGNLSLILALLFVMLLAKALIITLLVRAMGQTLAEGIKVGALLAQAGEFGFVLFTYARLEGVLEGSTVEILSATIALSMAVTPILFAAGDKLARRLSGDEHTITDDDEDTGPRNHVIIAGYGRVGATLARMFTNLKIDFVVVDMDPGNVRQARQAGYEAIFGDAARGPILHKAGAEKAALLIVTIDDPAAAKRMILTAKREYPTLKIYARTHNARTATELRFLGATHTVPETLEASLSLGAEAARARGANEVAIRSVIRTMRADNYLATPADGGAD